MFYWREGILHHKLDIEVHIYLMQYIAHVEGLRVCEHHEFDVRWRLVVVQFILASPVGYEAVIRPPELSHHIAQGEYSPEYELSIILCA